jgi:hypothetical protein
VTITDATQKWTYTTSSSVPGAQQSSAEWITETPYGCKTPSGFCYLTNFSPAQFGQQYAPITTSNGQVLLTASATVNGVTQALGNFSSSVQQSIMVDAKTGQIIMAEPNPSCPKEGSLQNLSQCSSSADATDLSDNGTSFPVNWHNAGP